MKNRFVTLYISRHFRRDRPTYTPNSCVCIWSKGSWICSPLWCHMRCYENYDFEDERYLTVWNIPEESIICSINVEEVRISPIAFDLKWTIASTLFLYQKIYEIGYNMSLILFLLQIKPHSYRCGCGGEGRILYPPPPTHHPHPEYDWYFEFAKCSKKFNRYL